MAKIVEIGVNEQPLEVVRNMDEPFAVVRQSCIDRCGKLAALCTEVVDDFDPNNNDEGVPAVLCDGTRSPLGCEAITGRADELDPNVFGLTNRMVSFHNFFSRLAVGVQSGLEPINLLGDDMQHHKSGRKVQSQETGYPQRFFQRNGHKSAAERFYGE